MEAAAAALQGPLRSCNINAKLDRWKALIAPHVANDRAAGLYPAQDGQQPDFDGNFADMKDAVPRHINEFRESVMCSGSAPDQSAWGELYR